MFLVDNATVPPKAEDITADRTPDFDVEFEATKWQYVYKMTVKNKTKPEPTDDVFAKVTEKKFEIKVHMEDEAEPVKGYVTAYMHPEGLTVDSKIGRASCRERV